MQRLYTNLSENALQSSLPFGHHGRQCQPFCWWCQADPWICWWETTQCCHQTTKDANEVMVSGAELLASVPPCGAADAAPVEEAKEEENKEESDDNMGVDIFS